MPRAARIDIPEILQHVIVRGIEKRDIFLDDLDRASFVQRLSRLLQETGTQCLAWALMSNHFHLLLRPRREKLSFFMRRLLTGYAVTFNRRHHRTGHLFQNRYKSVVCEDDPYLLELVRYIHLNPLRVGMVTSLEELGGYRWSGHAVLMERQTLAGQETGEILACFGKRTKSAREAYYRFVGDGIGRGRREELGGGGLQRVRKAGVDEDPIAFDDRILGSGEFVERLLAGRKADRPERPAVAIQTLVRQVADTLGLTPEAIRAPGRSRFVADARSVISYFAFRKMGHGGEAVAKALGITRSGVCRRADAGEHLVREDSRFHAFSERSSTRQLRLPEEE